MTEPEMRLRTAVSSLRTVGTVFAAMGALATFAVWHDALRNLAAASLLLSSGLLWVGPGALYHVTAALIRRHDARVAIVARRTALAQSALAVVGLALALFTGQFGRTGKWLSAFVPAIATIFFVPALLVQAYQIGKALEALRQLPTPGHGFEVQPTPVLPTEQDVPQSPQTRA